MTAPPMPVIFEPILKPKPWGGRKLAELFDKRLPAGQPIGESWELVSLPGNESRVRNGPHAGRTLAELVGTWGNALYGGAKLVDGRFPLLIKFLDARELLSVQVHPKPAPGDVEVPGNAPATGFAGPTGSASAPVAGVKYEAWYVLDADPGATLLAGLNPGVTDADLGRAANTPAIRDLLRRWPVQAGQCFYLPSGIVHALGAGIVVAEIQMPSDVTYRLYDWDRPGLDGSPRELHVQQALANVRTDIPDDVILQPAPTPAANLVLPCGAGTPSTRARVLTCERFLIDHVSLPRDARPALRASTMLIWIILAGTGTLVREQTHVPFGKGDVILIPADHASWLAHAQAACELLEITVPLPA